MSESRSRFPSIVLIGFAEAGAAPEAAWSLADHGATIHVFARRGRRAAVRHSRQVSCHEITPPEESLSAALSDLRNLLRALQPGEPDRAVVFPMDDTAVSLCSQLQLPAPWILAGPSGANAALALNKDLQIQLAHGAGFCVPPTMVARTADDLLTVRDSDFPIILKPLDCVVVQDDRVVNTRKWICADRGELQRAAAEWAGHIPVVVQPFIVGTGEGVFGLAAPDGVRAWSAHRRIRMMNPQGSGSSACMSQPVPAEIREPAEAFVRRAGWRGLFMIELLRDLSGKVWFVELNGRPWGSMALSRRQGLEYPAWHTELTVDALSRAGETTSHAEGLVCRNIGRELMHLLFVLRGPTSHALQSWPSFWKTVAQMMRIGRGDGVYNWNRQDPLVFFADCYYTVHGHLFKAR